MIIVRPGLERGLTKSSWLDSRHSFSFADYYDRNHMGFHSLRVINQDIILPATGFAAHSHQNMEIITLVIRGAVKHLDSMGNETMIKAGEIQLMSAGTGVTHSEFNPSKTEVLELLQIWILPAEKELTPSYQQMRYVESLFTLLISWEKEPNTLFIHQDVKVYFLSFNSKQQKVYKCSDERCLWLQCISGSMVINNINISAGDGAAIEDIKSISLTALTDCKCLLFDLRKQQ